MNAPDACPACGTVHHVDGSPIVLSERGKSKATGTHVKRCCACLAEWYVAGGQAKLLGYLKPKPEPRKVDAETKRLADQIEALTRPVGMDDMKLR